MAHLEIIGLFFVLAGVNILIFCSFKQSSKLYKIGPLLCGTLFLIATILFGIDAFTETNPLTMLVVLILLPSSFWAFKIWREERIDQLI